MKSHKQDDEDLSTILFVTTIGGDTQVLKIFEDGVNFEFEDSKTYQFEN